MRDPTVDLVTRELIEMTIGYLCEREVLELDDATNATIAKEPTTDEEWLIAMATTRKILELGLRPPAPRKPRGRPPQRRQRHLQIAGAVAMLVEDAGLRPTRSHCERRHQSPSACSIVTAALPQVGKCLDDYLGGYRSEHLSERAVEDIWDQYRRSPLIIHQGALAHVRNHRYRKSSGIIR
jgi:hypothetical protein